MLMNELNESQTKIANQLDGMIVVDAGPGTGKTKTIVERYINILDSGVDPKDIILLTFTRNAAQEMEDRIKGKMIHSHNANKCKDVRAGTFDSFCFSVVMESPEAVSRFFGISEKLTRSAKTVENETLNRVYFDDFMDRFLSGRSDDYGDSSTIASQHYSELYGIINKLMARGVVPIREGWFGGDSGTVLYGDFDNMQSILNKLNMEVNKDKYELSTYMLRDTEKYSFMFQKPIETEPLSEDMIDAAIKDDRVSLIKLLHDVYYEFLRRSIIDDRLTFGLVSSFAFVVLYSDDKTRERMRCRYLMVDEFQDTNSNQFMIALMLLKEPNLCVVGDWKQGIYGFRYVSTENITRFYDKGVKLRKFLNEDKERIPFSIEERDPMSLDINYRSSQLIIDLAYDSLYIRGNKDEKVVVENITRITAAKKYLDEHTAIECVSAPSSDEEIQEVLRRIENYVNNDRYMICEDEVTFRRVQYKDIAVLCRATSLACAIYEKASKAGIPVFLQGDVDIMGSREGKLLLAWLRYINNDSDPWGICTILADQGHPLCEIKEMTHLGSSVVIPAEIIQKRRELITKKRRVTNMIASIFDYYNLNNDITQTITSVLSSAHRGSLLTISDIIRMIETDIDSGTTYSVDSFLNRQAVIIQTMHKSKGLEYPVVIAAGFNQRSFPNTRSDISEYFFNDTVGIRSRSEVCPITEGTANIMQSWKTKLIMKTLSKDYSEERRLLFVAISRAKQYLTITAASKPSTFFNGLLEKSTGSPCGKNKVFCTSNEESDIMIERPKIDEFKKRRRNVGVHDILHFEGDDAPPEGSDQVCGKGMEYGKKVHYAAELLARGLNLDTEYSQFPENIEIKKVLHSVKDAVYIEPEIECALPFNDINVTLRGVIDLYAEFSDRVEIHDYKTDVSDQFEGEYKIQLSVYAHAAHEATGKRTVCVIDYVSQGRKVVFDPLEKECIRKRLADYS